MTRRNLARSFALLLSVALLVGLMAPVAQGAFTATLVLTPNSGLAGITVTADGSDHTPNSADVEIRWGAENGPLLATVTTDNNGEYSTTITIPGGAAPGTYDIIVCETAFYQCTEVDVQEFAVGAKATFTVDAPPTTTTSTTPATIPTPTVPDLEDFDSPIGVGGVGQFGPYGSPPDGFEPDLYIPRCVPPSGARILDFDTDTAGTIPRLDEHPGIATIPHLVDTPSTSTITPRQAIHVTGGDVRTVATFAGSMQYVGLYVGDLAGTGQPVELVARDVSGAVVSVDRIPAAGPGVDTCMTVLVEGAPTIAQVELHVDGGADIYADRFFYSASGDLPDRPTPVRGSIEFIRPTDGDELSTRIRQLVLGQIRIPAGFEIEDVTLSVPRWDRAAIDIRHIDFFPLWVDGDDQLYSFVASGIYLPEGPSYMAVTATGPGVLATGLIEVVGVGTPPFDTTTVEGRVDIVPVTLEVTQAVRGEVDLIPPGTRISERDDTVLVQNKKTVVRAFAYYDVPSGGTITGTVAANAELVGTRDGVALPGSPLAPESAWTTLTRYPDPAIAYHDAKQRTDGSWNFVLPDSWTDPGSIELRLQVNAPHLLGYIEEVEGGSDGVVNYIQLDDVVFRSKNAPAVNIWLVDYYYKCQFDDMGVFIGRDDTGRTLNTTSADKYCIGKTDGEVTHAQPTLAHAINAVAQSWKMAPLPGAFPSSFDTWEYTFATDGVTDDELEPGPMITPGSPQEGFWLGVALRMELIVGNDGYNALNALMTSFIRGKAWGSPSFYRTTTLPETWLHEAGHTMGLRHTGSLHGEGNSISRWNYDHGLIGETPEVVSAFDTGEMQALPFIVSSTNALHDLMSYGTVRWTSWQAWRHIEDAVGSGVARPDHRGHADTAATGAAPPRFDGAPPDGEDDEVVTLRGRITDSGVELEAAFNFPGGVVSNEGDLVVRALDADGAVLSEIASAVITDSEGEGAAFSVPVLVPDEAVEIVIVLDGGEIDRRAVTSAPAVTFDESPTDPVSGETTISWSADGPGVEAYLVEVSRDGEQWYPLALTAEPVFELDPSSYRFQGPDWRLRIQTTTGTAISISPEIPVDFGMRPTEPMIALPMDGSTYASNTFIPLQAAVSSFAAGEQDDLIWELDGTRVGEGPTGVTVAGDPGTHEITLTQPATGQTVSVTIEVFMDSDLDTMSDEWETEWGFDPLDAADAASDDDDDGASAWLEHAHGASPDLPDTDGDGFDDGTEIAFGTDPTDPDSIPSDVGTGDTDIDQPDVAQEADDGDGPSIPIIVLLSALGGALLAAGALWLRRR